MSRALGPHQSMAPGGTAAGWTLLACCWALVALSWLIWAAARLASATTGGRVEPFGTKFAGDVLHGRTYRAWPHTPTVAVTAAAIVLACGAAVLAGFDRDERTIDELTRAACVGEHTLGVLGLTAHLG